VQDVHPQQRADRQRHPEHAHQPHAHDGYHMDFSDTGRFASHFDDPKRDTWQRPADVLRLLDVRPGQTVVDLGAGTGYFVGLLSRAVSASGRVLALDAEPKMVEHLTSRAARDGLANVSARVVPYGDPELGRASIDRVLIVNTWHHLDDRPSYAVKLRAALRKGGMVLVVDFTPESDIGPPPEHRLPAAVVAEDLARAGLRAEIVAEEPLPKQYVVRGAID
jgi:predicted methyltransferase